MMIGTDPADVRAAASAFCPRGRKVNDDERRKINDDPQHREVYSHRRGVSLPDLCEPRALGGFAVAVGAYADRCLGVETRSPGRRLPYRHGSDRRRPWPGMAGQRLATLSPPPRIV